IGCMSSKNLWDICYFDIRQIRQEDGIDDYMGIQRQISKKRVTEIKQYVKNIDATFPTGVILAVEEIWAIITLSQQVSNGPRISHSFGGLPRGGAVARSTGKDSLKPRTFSEGGE